MSIWEFQDWVITQRPSLRPPFHLSALPMRDYIFKTLYCHIRFICGKIIIFLSYLQRNLRKCAKRTDNATDITLSHFPNSVLTINTVFSYFCRFLPKSFYILLWWKRKTGTWAWCGDCHIEDRAPVRNIPLLAIRCPWLWRCSRKHHIWMLLFLFAYLTFWGANIV